MFKIMQNSGLKKVPGMTPPLILLFTRWISGTWKVHFSLLCLEKCKWSVNNFHGVFIEPKANDNSIHKIKVHVNENKR